VAIDRPARGSDDEPLAAGIGRRLEQGDCAHDIDARVTGWVADRARDTTLGGEVEDCVGLEALDRRRGFGAAELGHHLVDAGRGGRAAGVAQVVDDEHGLTRFDQLKDGVMADEAGTAGDQHPLPPSCLHGGNDSNCYSSMVPTA
jgi:hypothetical protein